MPEDLLLPCTWGGSLEAAKAKFKGETEQQRKQNKAEEQKKYSSSMMFKAKALLGTAAVLGLVYYMINHRSDSIYNWFSNLIPSKLFLAKS